MSDGPGAFATCLRRFRERAVLTQEELAERAGLTGKAIGSLERGERRRPQPHTLRALADALRLDEADRAALTEAGRGHGHGSQETGPAPPPGPATPLIGRDAERAELAALLSDGATRLLTVTGPGGVGKTSLALDVAREVAADFAGAVAVVELAPVREARLVLPAIGRALGARQPDLDAVASYLGRRRQLVVLDNCEHVLDAAPDVAELLTRCPGLVLLATSRAALRIRAEQERPLDPLPLPARSGATAAAASPAVQVFLDRARAAGRPVALTEATAADVAAICRRLDGLPLALELAAAHTRFLSPAALLSRLDSAVSAPGSRDLPARQRTMRATLDWSHDLLTADEQVLLRRLAVFAGGCTLPAAEHVAGLADVVPALGGLVEQSLVVADGDRYRMLEPVRQYAAVRLAEAGEEDAVADRAADWFQRLGSGARGGLLGAEQTGWLDRLQREHANTGATLGRLVDRGRVDDAAELAAGTWLYWALRADAAEGLGWMQRIAALAPGPGVQGRLGLAIAGLRYAAGDIPGMREPSGAAVAAARATGDDELLAEALVLAGSASLFLGDFARAAGELTEAERWARASGHRWAEAHTAIARGQLLIRQGDTAAATAVLTEAEHLARESGSPFALATVLNVQGSLLQLVGEDDAAVPLLVEGAEVSVSSGITWTLVYSVLGLAVSAAQRSAFELAAQLFAAGSATEESTSVTVSFPPDLEGAQRWLPVVRERLGEAAFQRAWDVGRSLRPADVPGLVAPLTRAPG